MASQRLINHCLQSSTKTIMTAITSSDASTRAALFSALLVDKSDVRIKTLFRARPEDLHPFNASIFAHPVSAAEALAHVDIGNGALRHAATFFYGQNRFVADDLADLGAFANGIEPDCHAHVRALVLTDGVFAPDRARRDADGLCAEDHAVIQVLRQFPALHTIVFSFSWDFGGRHSQRVIDAICCEARSLQVIQIQRPMRTRMGCEEGANRVRVEDARLQYEINVRLRDRMLCGGPMAMGW
ncbi:hypothetical protein MMC13_002517 [Lambiella insularis]|nr:hypothetical protein [Lambiella insularis]